MLLLFLSYMWNRDVEDTTYVDNCRWRRTHQRWQGLCKAVLLIPRTTLRSIAQQRHPASDHAEINFHQKDVKKWRRLPWCYSIPPPPTSPTHILGYKNTQWLNEGLVVTLNTNAHPSFHPPHKSWSGGYGYLREVCCDRNGRITS